MEHGARGSPSWAYTNPRILLFFMLHCFSGDIRKDDYITAAIRQVDETSLVYQTALLLSQLIRAGYFRDYLQPLRSEPAVRVV